MRITYTYLPSVTPPLACDCRGAVVYARLKTEFRLLTRDRTGVARGILQARRQLSDGSWLYEFDLDDFAFVSPLPSVSGGMVEAICCQGCTGYALEALNFNEFGGRLVAAGQDLSFGSIFELRRTVRPFHVVDVRAFIDGTAAGDVSLQLLVNDETWLHRRVTVPAGKTVSDNLWTFAPGVLGVIPENATVEIEVTADGHTSPACGSPTPPADGLEFYVFGRLNPGTYFPMP